MTRPTVAPDFATDTNYVAAAKPWDGLPTKVAPGGIKTEGWEPQAVLAAQHLNYMLNNHAAWLNYLDSPGGGIFGNGVDGAAAFNGGAVTGASGTGPYTLTRDVFYSSATLSAGVVLNTAGFRLFVNGILDTSVVSATIQCDGVVGQTGLAGGAGGARPGASGILGAAAGGAGAAGGTDAGGSQTLAIALGSSGGTGGTGTGGGAPGTSAATAPTAAMGSIYVPDSIYTGMLFGASGVSVINGGCGGGGGQGSGGGPRGGGGGGGGGVLLICARTVNCNGTTLLSAKGGAGGAGDVSSGGGGGGGGGAILIIYRNDTGSTAIASVTANVAGGAGGALGAGGGNGAAGTTGQKILYLT